MLGSNDRRTRGSAGTVVLGLLLVVGAVLSLNYVRNYHIDQQDEKNKRPYARYEAAALGALAEGYRMELAAAEKRHGKRRVQTRRRHHFSDQIQEFERVQREARKARESALDVVEIRQDLQTIEAEQQHRAAGADGIAAHLTRMFRL